MVDISAALQDDVEWLPAVINGDADSDRELPTE